MGFRQTFNDFTPWYKRILIGSLVLGVILCVAFSLTDLGINVTLGSWDPKPERLKQFNAEWYHNHAYIPNMFAALTGSLIGVPIAAVVLATFTFEREQKAEERAGLKRVNTISELAWNKFRQSALEFCSMERINAFNSEANTHMELMTEIGEQYKAYQERCRLGDFPTPQEHSELIQYLLRANFEFGRAISRVTGALGNSFMVDIQWFTMRTNWNMLDQDVRLQRAQQGLRWFSDNTSAQISERVSAAENPLTVYSPRFEQASDLIRNRIRSCLDRPYDALNETIAADAPSYDDLVHQFVEIQIEVHQAVMPSLTGMVLDLVRIQHSGWPGSESVPRPDVRPPWFDIHPYFEQLLQEFQAADGAAAQQS